MLVQNEAVRSKARDGRDLAHCGANAPVASGAKGKRKKKRSARPEALAQNAARASVTPWIGSEGV